MMNSLTELWIEAIYAHRYYSHRWGKRTKQASGTTIVVKSEHKTIQDLQIEANPQLKSEALQQGYGTVHSPNLEF